MQQDIDQQWIKFVRQNNKTTNSWACALCLDRKIFTNVDALFDHALTVHPDRVPSADDAEALRAFRAWFENESKKKTSNNPPARMLMQNETSRPQTDSAPGQSKRPLSSPDPPRPTRTLSAIGALNIGTPHASEDVTMEETPEDDTQRADLPRKRHATGDGISAGSASREHSPELLPRRSKGRPNSAPHGVAPDEARKTYGFEPSRPNVARKQLWTPDQNTPINRASVNPSNIASVQANKSRQQAHRLPPPGMPSSPQAVGPKVRSSNAPQDSAYANVAPHQTSPRRPQRQPAVEAEYDLLLQPETRPISQEQLVAEVKGIYAGLVMVEARCIEIDKKHADLAQADPSLQPKLNNEQWQALIALHRSLLHEHHDFFLASQHPSASIALRRLASKYAMPARMWRHGIHSFLELLRHRLPLSLDHMLAFIYLAYSMMALLYETVPAFEDTWIECLGDLARYRMAIEDDDIRDREVWTGVARHWYSKASNKAATTGRLYHHLAILARPNALQQLFYYSKSLCVEVPFTSARESVLTLFEPIINATGPTQYRLPPLDTVFIRAHGLLFTGKDMDKFEPTVAEFLVLLDNQIGRVTRKFMEQGYYIAIANSVAVLAFASKGNVLMRAIAASQNKSVVEMSPPQLEEDPSLSMASFRSAESLFDRTFEINLQRIGDPNVLPFVHVTLVFILYVSEYPAAMSLIQANIPWGLLSALLNTLLGSYKTPTRIEDDKFPLPEKEAVRHFPEDHAMRGLLWTMHYFPEKFFDNSHIDEEDKYREAASLTEERKERILWIGCKIAQRGPWMQYTREGFSIPTQPNTVPIESLLQPTISTPERGPDGEPEMITPESQTLASEIVLTPERLPLWMTEPVADPSMTPPRDGVVRHIISDN